MLKTEIREIEIDKELLKKINKQIKIKNTNFRQSFIADMISNYKIYKTPYNIRIFEVEIKYLKYQKEKLEEKNNIFENTIHKILDTFKYYFNIILHIGDDFDKSLVVKEIKDYHKLKYYENKDLKDISRRTSKEREINNYLYNRNHNSLER